MAQSNNEYVRGILSFWQNHTVYPAIPWEYWNDLFLLIVIANENVDIKNLLNPIKRHPSQPPVLEDPTENKSENQRILRLERNIGEQKRYDDQAATSIKSETKQFDGMRIEETDKKLCSILYLALGNKRKRIFEQKLTRVKNLKISFKKFWENLATAFVRITKVTFIDANC